MDVAAAQPLVFEIEAWIDLILLIAVLVVAIVAVGNCLVQRPDAFPAINTLSKRAWLALNGGAVLVTVLSLFGFLYGLLFAMVAVAVVGVYLLDVRPALRDGVDGHGSW
jgi:hypothetical protein